MPASQVKSMEKGLGFWARRVDFRKECEVSGLPAQTADMFSCDLELVESNRRGQCLGSGAGVWGIWACIGMEWTVYKRIAKVVV